ncbi:hypothetical protein ACVWZ4_005858 [Bradyrhizobium sp. USDA 4472]
MSLTLGSAVQADVAGRIVAEDAGEEVFAKRAMVRSGNMSAKAATAPTNLEAVVRGSGRMIDAAFPNSSVRPLPGQTGPGFLDRGFLTRSFTV